MKVALLNRHTSNIRMLVQNAVWWGSSGLEYIISETEDYYILSDVNKGLIQEDVLNLATFKKEYYEGNLTLSDGTLVEVLGG